MPIRIKDADVQALKTRIAARLEKLREDQEFSQQALADELGTTQNLIYRSEHDLKISLETFLLMMIFYQRNVNLNLEWFIAPDNTGMSPYTTDTKLQRKKLEGKERQRNQIIDEMFEKLRANDLLPEEEKS